MSLGPPNKTTKKKGAIAESGCKGTKCCTHRPSLLPIECFSEASGLAAGSWQQHPAAGNLFKLEHLEEVKVVTRSLLPRFTKYAKPLQPETVFDTTINNEQNELQVTHCDEALLASDCTNVFGNFLKLRGNPKGRSYRGVPDNNGDVQQAR
jgi:hypothetical protein